MRNIVFEKNCILENLKKAKQQNRKIYIYGCGQMGKIVSRKLNKEKIEYDAFIINRAYIQKENIEIDGKPILVMEDLNTNTSHKEKPIVVIAFRDPDQTMLFQMSSFAEIINADSLSLWFLEDCEDLWTKNFFEKNIDKLLQTDYMLSDDKSRESMWAFLQQKLSGRFSYLENIWEPDQYFDGEIVDISKVQSFVDCGAYDGDSFLALADSYKKRTGKKYSGKAYLLEPDNENYKKLMDNCNEYQNNIYCQVGAWNERNTLVFDSDGTLSSFSSKGSTRIEVDTIDNLTHENADFIKMDIEGAELAALQGAQNTIKKCHPILAVCIYHKSNDLWTIPNYIKSIDDSYHFYIRAHSNYSMELVLYAI